MSRLDELIAELCPDGVAYIPMGSFMTRVKEKGKNDPEVSQVYVVSNTQGIVKAEDYRDNAVHSEDTSNYTIIRPGMIAYNPSRLNIGSIAMLNSDVPGLVSPMYVVFKINEDVILKPYFEYLMKSSLVALKINSFKEEGARFRFDFSRWSWIEVQVPPLEVQREIVRVLNNFTLYSADLSAELSARRKQYEYYRSKLLSYDNNIELKKLGDTCDMRAGKAIPSSQISESKTEGCSIKCYGGNGLRGYVKEANHHGEFPLIGRQGALCGNVNYAIGDFYATEHAVVVKSKGEYSQRFLYHLLTHMNLNQYKSAGAQPGLAVKNLQEIKAPVPSIKEQERIVQVLDSFEIICSDLRIGLPAEIEARQKQYEYYRDALLTFIETGTMIATDRQTDRQTESD